MSRIPFIEACFYDPDETRIHIEHRLFNHQRKLRAARLMSLKNNMDLEGADPDFLIAEQTSRTITRRAKRLLERREATSCLSHLKREDRERLEVLREGVTLIQIASEHRADELAAHLHAGMPWMAPATEIVWQAMRRSVREGWPGLLPLLEPLSARRWSCPYYQVKFDMSWVIWVMTSNDYSRLPGPLLSRCPPLRLQALTLAELIGFARRQGDARGLSETALAALVEVLEAAPLPPHRLSLRTVIRLLDRAADLQNAPTRH